MFPISLENLRLAWQQDNEQLNPRKNLCTISRVGSSFQGLGDKRYLCGKWLAEVNRGQQAGRQEAK